MLILARKVNESIRIGSDVEVIVTQFRGGRVRLGVKAPPDVAVVRTELLDTPPQDLGSQKEPPQAA